VDIESRTVSRKSAQASGIGRRSRLRPGIMTKVPPCRRPSSNGAHLRRLQVRTKASGDVTSPTNRPRCWMQRLVSWTGMWGFDFPRGRQLRISQGPHGIPWKDADTGSDPASQTSLPRSSNGRAALLQSADRRSIRRRGTNLPHGFREARGSSNRSRVVQFRTGQLSWLATPRPRRDDRPLFQPGRHRWSQPCTDAPCGVIRPIAICGVG
jgi:hypothetical protein